MPLIPSPWDMGTPTGVVLAALVATLGAYFLGCFNGAVIVSKYILRDDVRNHGSGNAGLTNFFRTFGGILTLVVILLDVVKAILAVWLGQLAFHFVSWPGLEIYGKYWAGLCCLLGHVFPCMFHFKGGKGILSGGTILFMLDWRVALIAWGGFLILTALTRWVSLGSCFASASFPFSTWFFSRDAILTLIAAVIACLLLVKHRANIQRLLAGNENKLSFHRKKEGG